MCRGVDPPIVSISLSVVLVILLLVRDDPELSEYKEEEDSDPEEWLSRREASMAVRIISSSSMSEIRREGRRDPDDERGGLLPLPLPRGGLGMQSLSLTEEKGGCEGTCPDPDPDPDPDPAPTWLTNLWKESISLSARMLLILSMSGISLL
jgi:hypothetical protein